jgi:hypothetical protein
MTAHFKPHRAYVDSTGLRHRLIERLVRHGRVDRMVREDWHRVQPCPMRYCSGRDVFMSCAMFMNA